MVLKSLLKTLGAMCAAALLSGCGADDIQLEGKVFDAIGINTASTNREAPKIKARSGLVVPPDLAQLPEPGSGKVAQPELAVADHDEKHAISQAELERQHKEFCEKNYDTAKALGNQDAELIEGPLGKCHKSVMNLVDINGKSADGEQ